MRGADELGGAAELGARSGRRDLSHRLAAPDQRSGTGLHASAGFDGYEFAGEHGLVEQDFSPGEVHIRGDHRTEGKLHHIARRVTGKAVGSEEEAVAALPAILAYNRRAVRQGFEEKFTATRMAQDYISTYRRLMKTRTSDARPRQPALNGGNGLAPNSTEKPFVPLFEAGADPEIPT